MGARILALKPDGEPAAPDHWARDRQYLRNDPAEALAAFRRLREGTLAHLTALSPEHAIYLRVLRAMTPEQRLRKAFELTATARVLFALGLRRRFPDMDEAAFTRLLRQRLDQCHNRRS